MRNILKEKLLAAQQEQDAKIRASIKEKMLKDGPNRFTEVDAVELAYIMRTDITDLIEEVNAELAAAQNQASEPGLMAMAGDMAKEPDHAAYLRGQDALKEAIQPFEEVVKPLMKWLAQNVCPHHHVVVSATSAELFQGQKSFNTFEFIKD